MRQPSPKVIPLPVPVPASPVPAWEREIEQQRPVLQAEYRALLIRARASAQISDGDAMRTAEQVARDIAAWKKRVVLLYERIKAHYHRRHDNWCRAETELLNPAETTYKAVKGSIKAYLQLIEQRRREAQQAAYDEALRKQMQALPASRVPLPLHVPPPTPASDARMTGSAVSRPWCYSVDDIVELARAVVAGTVPPDAICPNDAFLKEQVSRYGTALRYPGVRVYQDVNVTIR